MYILDIILTNIIGSMYCKTQWAEVPQGITYTSTLEVRSLCPYEEIQHVRMCSNKPFSIKVYTREWRESTYEVLGTCCTELEAA